ncbi:MAG: UDP-N-acetylmuramate--L-alanine ligase [Phycisphaeraceae bacterium]|nr:UDP-N-acetylmuramate--L-alanine ligase [Phycisphaeraceae bacterium]
MVRSDRPAASVSLSPTAVAPRSFRDAPRPGDPSPEHPAVLPDGSTAPAATGGQAIAGSGLSSRRVHCIGIGGCGVSGLALLLRNLGARVSGSDASGGPMLARLQERGIRCCVGQDASNLDADVDLVVASAAIREGNPELVEATRRGIRVAGYAEALGLLQAERTGVSIAGTHGKSTTTAMLAHVLIECGLDPGFIVGAMCDQIGGGSRVGADRIPIGPLAGRPGILAAEACEFARSFHHHRPTIGAILNIEADHLDIYGSLDAIIEAFHGFARLLPPAAAGGRLLIAEEGAHRREVTAGVSAPIATFGFSPQSTYQVVTDAQVQRVGLLRDGVWLAQWTNRMPGAHNALNAAAAGILASWLGAGGLGAGGLGAGGLGAGDPGAGPAGAEAPRPSAGRCDRALRVDAPRDDDVDWERIAAALDGFTGVERRMQRLGTRRIAGGAVTIYDDYGHHPTEVDATLRALRAAEKPRRLVCVFQPHQHSRTRFLLDEFARSFSAADVVIVPSIYFVRDSEIERACVSAGDLVDRLRARGIMAMHIHPFEAIVEQLEVVLRPDDLLVIMGAGPVGRIAHDFMAAAPGAVPAAALAVH